MSKKILIVEDERSLHTAYLAAMEDLVVEFVFAATMLEATAAFQSHDDFDAIFVDGCFPHADDGDALPQPGSPCNGEKFVIWLRGGRGRYTGPIFACSSYSEFNDRMIACGATRAVPKGRGICDAVAALLAPTPAG